MGKKKIDPYIRASADIEDAMKRIVPAFGNANQIDIMAQHEKVLNLITLLEREQERMDELKRISKKAAKAKEEIRKEEECLRFLLEKEGVLSPVSESNTQSYPQQVNI